MELPVHNLGLSSDELTLSASGMSEASGLSLAFYDVRTFINKVINSHNNPPTANGVVRFRHGETEFRAHALISIESTPRLVTNFFSSIFFPHT